MSLGGRIVAVPRIEVTGIKGVQTPLPSEQKDNQPVRKISFETEVDLYVVIESFPLPSPLKVGEESSSRGLEAMLAGLQGPKREKQVLRRRVEVEATATIRDNEYKDVQFVSARLK